LQRNDTWCEKDLLVIMKLFVKALGNDGDSFRYMWANFLDQQ